MGDSDGALGSWLHLVLEDVGISEENKQAGRPECVSASPFLLLSAFQTDRKGGGETEEEREGLERTLRRDFTIYSARLKQAKHSGDPIVTSDTKQWGPGLGWKDAVQ